MKKFVQSLVLAFAFIFLAAPAVSANSNNNPAGNNGFVKINNQLAPDSIPNNHPHVSCTFSVEFYNYDKGDYNASVKFELQQPAAGSGYSLSVAKGSLNPFTGGDAAGGGNDLDASEVYKLAFTGQPHDKQGYHVKLTVNAPGSKGSDKKHKVFWVKPCNETEPQVLGTSTPGTLPVTGASASATLLAASVAGVGYAGRYLQLKRRG
jgi:hypothetical protein